jgi:hypothetical protein
MLKRLVILVLLSVGLSCGTWSQVPQDGSQQEKYANKQEGKAESVQSSAIATKAQKGTSKQEQNSEQKPSRYLWRELYAPANIPNWVLAFFAGVAGWLAYKTLRAIKKQAEIMEAQAKDARESSAGATKIALATAQAARKSADAAMAQIQLMKEQSHRMVEKERARLKVQCEGVEVQWGPTGTWILVADIEIANHGSSNAYITRKRGKLSVAPIREDTPELDDSCDMLLPYPFDIIKPEVEPIHVVVYLEDAPSSFRDLCIEITSSRLTMHLYGFIDYETMGECWRLPFRYKWVMSTIQDNISERDLANDINIVGGWDKPCEQGNGEYRINPN